LCGTRRASPANIGAVISVNENPAAPCARQLPLEPRSDRQAAHYYRSQHSRAVLREQPWKQRALAAEKILAQWVVWVGWYGQQIGALKRQLAWLKKQPFGGKSEATQNRLAGSPEGATEPSAAVGSAEGVPAGAEPVGGGGAARTPRRRGQQPGGPGPKRHRRLPLPEPTTHHTLTEAGRTCPICGKLRPATGLTEPSEEIEWPVNLVRRRHVRHRYGPSCDCPPGRGLRSAPKPAKLIPQGLFASNGQRRQAGFQKQAQRLAALEAQARCQVQEMKAALDRELAGRQLAGEPEKILQSLRRPWQGLTVFGDHPHAPMDNNAAARANRPLAVARKNYYGSGAEWSGELACACFTILAPLRQHGMGPRRYFQAYFETCARQGGRAPEKLEEFLPWKGSPEQRAAWTRPEHPP
jgi:hypothetical protein